MNEQLLNDLRMTLDKANAEMIRAHEIAESLCESVEDQDSYAFQEAQSILGSVGDAISEVEQALNTAEDAGE